MGSDRARDVHCAKQVHFELAPHCGIGKGLEEAQLGIAGIVDQDVYCTEPLDGLDSNRICGSRITDIERNCVEALVFPEGIAHRVDGSRCCRDLFARIKSRACNLASQSPACARHQPNLCHSRVLALFQLSTI